MDAARAWRACWCGKLTHLNGIALQRCTTRLGRFGGSTRLGVNFFLFVSSSRYSDKSFTNQRKRESFLFCVSWADDDVEEKQGKKLFCLYRARGRREKPKKERKFFMKNSIFILSLSFRLRYIYSQHCLSHAALKITFILCNTEKSLVSLAHGDDADVRAVCIFLFTNQLQQQPAACVKMCGARERLDLSVSERGKLGTAFDLSKQVNRLSEAQKEKLSFSLHSLRCCCLLALRS